MTAAIEVNNLRKIYEGGLEALKGIDLFIPEGSFYGLLGPNGAGKTTTIGIITGLVHLTSGTASVMGYDTIREYRKFYEGLASLSSYKLKIHCSALNVGKVKVATHVGFIDGSTFYYLMPANTGGQLKKYSPSRILLMELIKWSIANGLKFFDLTIGDDAYKKKWYNVESSLHETLKINSLKGWIYITFFKMKSLLKKSSFIRKLVRALRS